MTPPALRVLHLCAGNLYGGVERIVAECARSRAAVPSMAPSFAVAFDGRLAAELDAAEVRCTRLGGARARHPWTVVRARRRLAAQLEAHPVHAVLCHSSWMYAIAAPVVRRTTATLALWLHDRVSGRPLIERVAGLTVPDLVISNSAFTAETVAAMYSSVPKVVVYAPVAPADPLGSAERTALRASLGASAGTPVVLIASRMEAWKGHRELIAALSSIRAPWQLWIAGAAQRPAEEGYAQSLRALAAERRVTDRVRFLGERTDVPVLMGAADILCQPNTGPEPFGLAFVEALYAGLPVITTGMGGAREIVTETCGVLVPPSDPAALAQALQALLSDPMARARRSAGGPGRARLLCDPARQLGLLGAVLRGQPVAAGAA